MSFDKQGDQHYDYASALIKSMRGSDPDASLYYLAAMLEGGEDPRFIARRMVILASEDIGNADPQALVVATAAGQAVDRVGLPECALNLAQAAIYLALAPKSNAATRGIAAAIATRARARRQAASRLPSRRPLPGGAQARPRPGLRLSPRRARRRRRPAAAARRRWRASAFTSPPIGASRASWQGALSLGSYYAAIFGAGHRGAGRPADGCLGGTRTTGEASMHRTPEPSQRLRGAICAAAIISVALATLALGASPAAAGSAKKGRDGYADDPRSGAALNRDAAEIARSPSPSPPALFRGNRVINAASVNNPAADTSAQDTQSETAVAADGDFVVTAWSDSGSCFPSCGSPTNHFTGYGNSRAINTGGSFTDRGTLPSSSNGDAGGPALAINNATDDVFVTTLGFNFPNQIPIFKSTDGGATFGAPVNSVPGGVDLDKEWLAVDNFPGAAHGNLYVCVTDSGFSRAHVVVTHSTDDGATWSPAGGVVLSSTGQSQGCYVAVGPDHSVYVAYFRGNAPNALFIRRSTDGGVSFGAQHRIATLNTTSVNGDLSLNGGLRSNSFPHMAVNPVSGHIVAVWNDDPARAAGVDRGNVYYKRSADNGTTWSPRVRINDDGARDQFFPTVAISPAGGEIMFGYYSRIHDPSNFMFHRRIRPALMNRTTGAITMRPSAQLGPDTPITIGQDPVVDATYMGGYDVIEPNNSTFFSTWSDNRAGASPFGTHARQPDVWIARVARTAPSTNTDVVVKATPTPARIDEGSTTTILIEATATGHSARDVYVSLAPPTGLAFQSASGNCDLINGFVGCSLGTIAAGATTTRNVVTTGTMGGTHTATAKVTTTDNDANQGDNSGSAAVTVNPATTQTFSTGDIDVWIPEDDVLDIPVNVGPVGNVVDVDALVRLDTSWAGNLGLYLDHPNGTGSVELASETHSGSGPDFGSGPNSCSGSATRFDDEALTPIEDSASPRDGSFQPSQPLSTLDGLEESGEWNLHIANFHQSPGGTVGCVQLIIRRPSP